jgi:hypothetical protein
MVAGVIASVSCVNNEYSITDLSGQLAVSPEFKGVRQGEAPILYTATIDGAPAQVTWSSSDTTIAKVSSTGIVNPFGEGFVAITATLASDPTKKRSASLSVRPLFRNLTNRQAISNIGGAVGDTLWYKVTVPAGQSSLVIQMSGGTGDLDLYTRFGAPPAYGRGNWDCRPYAAGNNETCTYPNPTAGVYYIWLDVYEDASGVSLKATFKP